MTDAAALARWFATPGVDAVALAGSHARGLAGPHSDVDVLRLASTDDPQSDDGSHAIDGALVVVSTLGPAAVEATFTDPREAVDSIGGLRSAVPVVDPAGTFARLQARARAFEWDDNIQVRANRWAGAHLAGLAEEAHKGIEGLRRRDVGRLLQARFGCSWGLLRCVQVARGVLVSSDNAILDEVVATIGPESAWARRLLRAFGAEGPGSPPPSLEDAVRAGLAAYVETAALLDGKHRRRDAAVIALTVERILASELGPPLLQ